MSCFRCGKPGPEGAFFCPWCGVSLRPLPSADGEPASGVAREQAPGASASLEALANLADGDATIVAKPARPAAAATLTPPPIDSDATFVGLPGSPGLPLKADIRSPEPAQAQGSGLRRVDPDATMAGTPLPLDPDATIVGLPPPASRLQPLDPDATMAGTPAPIDPDATIIGTPSPIRRAGRTPRPKTPRPDPGATVIAPRGATPVPEGGAAEGPEGEAEEQGPLDVGQQFGRYTIIRMLGIGGMGAVYQAWDEELEVAVAIKVIRPEITADPIAGRELEKRFKRELLLARQVTHKNVVRIHDLGEMEGIKYITMSYVHGRELASIVKEEGRLPVQKALKIMRGVVSGLAAANGAGVVHRDLKPANIMVEAETDEPLIMDFGIARSASAPDKDQQSAAASQAQLAGMAGAASGKTPSALTQATTVGAIVGTVSYMSPEQVRAEEVDQRADLYALGLIFYDLLLGPKRFEGLNPIEELQKRMVEPPASPRSVDDVIPEALDRIIMRCLAPDRNERYETTADLESELNKLDDNGVPLPVYRRLTWRTMTAAATLTLSLMGATYWLTRPPPAKPAPPPTSVLVTDFVDKTNTPVFKGTLESALVQGMEGAAFITAFPRSTAHQIVDEQIKQGAPLDVPAARLVSAREGIKIVLAGTVERDGDGYSVKVDAIDPAVDKVLSSAVANAPTQDRVLAAVGSAAAKLRGALGDTTPESARVAAAETVTAASLEALQAYVRAQELAAARKDNEALEGFQQAIRLDPEFGRAYAGLGVVYWNIGDDAKAKAAYDKAMQFVGRMSEREKFRTLGTYYMFIVRNYEKAIENYEALVRLYPADDAAHGNLSIAYLFTGNLKGAIEQAREVLKLNPRSTTDRYNYAMYSLYASDLDTAVKEGNNVAKESPAFTPGGLLPVALAALLGGDRDGAMATYRRLEEASPAGASLGRFGRGDLLMYQGRYREALKLLQEAVTADGKEQNAGWVARDQVAMAEGHLALGQKARAIEAARKAATLTENESVLVPAALVLIAAGRQDEAEKIAVRLENMLQTHMTAYARLISAEIAVSRDRYAEAIELFRDSIKRRDTWLGRFLLGRLYAQSEHYPEALAELDACYRRRGEAADVFFADRPTARYLPPALYWLARSQQALGVASAKDLYAEFLELRGNASPPDPLAVDARQRVATLTK